MLMCRLAVSLGCGIWLLISACVSANPSEILQGEHVETVEGLAEHGLFVGLYNSEWKLNDLDILLCYRPGVAVEKVAVAVRLARSDALVFTSSELPLSTDDEGYFRFAFVVGRKFIDDSDLALFNLASEEGGNEKAVTGATIVPLSIIVAGAKRYDESAWLLNCSQVAPDG